MTTAEVMIACDDINAALGFYVDRLGFRVDSIFPAEAPVVAVLRGHGLRLRLDPEARSSEVALRISSTDLAALGGPGQLVAPDGTTVDLVDADPRVVLPPLQQSFVLQRAADDASWTVGRAGMRYRDLIPGRQGGRFVASHIHIPTAGPVPDYVHFHKIRFQMIYCYRGWTRLVYEDQGEPFTMQAGDCVLQPPRIRHRVLESSAGLEVIEIGCPALHETLADPEMSLPTATVRPDRDFDGQRFVFHQAADAKWTGDHDGFQRRRFGFTEATSGLAEASVLRSDGSADSPLRSHDGEFLFGFVLDGRVALRRESASDTPLTSGDCFVIPANQEFALIAASADLGLLEVVLPARIGSGRDDQSTGRLTAIT
jgi:quercetin dioxygenase-like cupin family protein